MNKKQHYNLINSITLAVVLMLLLMCMSACEDADQPESPSTPLVTYDYRIDVRTTQFVDVEGVKFMDGDNEIPATYADGVYTFSWDGPYNGYTVVKDGMRFGEYQYYDGTPYDPNSKLVKRYFVAAESDSTVDLTKSFGFHGKVVDARTGEIGIPNVQIKVGDVVVFTTDETGNFDINNLYEETWFTFHCEGYTFNPSFVSITEETEALRIREVIQEK